MALIRLTKAFTFEMAHALPGHDGPCKHIHGHTYELFVTVIGSPDPRPESPKYGMIMDFKDIKYLVKEAVTDRFDHALVLPADAAPTLLRERPDALFARLILLDYQPTTENLIADFAERIKKRLPPAVRLYSLKLRETTTSFAEWFAGDNE
jgi:6-pyruvoyltetrahydropterin/6-carboxytetrahydropterin synthase